MDGYIYIYIQIDRLTLSFELQAIAARLPSCESDEGVLWLLAALRLLLRVPAPAHPDVAPMLAALWEVAVRERRDLIAAELRRCAAVLR